MRILLIILCCLAPLAGCRFPGKNLAAEQAVAEQLAAQAAETPEQKVRRLEGELRQAVLERDDARLAGARRLLNWCTGILALCAVGGVVAAIFMKSKMLAWASLACAGGAASCQVFQRALDHIELISWLALGGVVLVGGWMLWRYHRD